MPQTAIWPGSSSFAPGQTPFGIYDSDTQFSGSSANSVDRFSDWCAKRLGYPIMDVEMQSGSFYAVYEESVTEYSAQVNQFNIKDNLFNLTGQSTGSNLTHRNVTPTLGRTVKLSGRYGTEASTPVGGNVELKSGSIDTVSGSQTYEHVTIIDNISGYNNGGGIYNWGSHVYLKNSINWGNQGTPFGNNDYDHYIYSHTPDDGNPFLNSDFTTDKIISFSLKFFEGILTILEFPLNNPKKKEYIKFVATFDGQT